MKKLKICIICEEAYPYFIGKGLGGSERQMYLLAKEFSMRGHEVHFIVFGEKSNLNEKIDDINVYNPYNYHKSGWTHFLPDKLWKYSRLLNKINANVYIQRAGPLTTSLLRLQKKIFIFSISDNASVSTNLNIKSLKDLKNIFHIINIKMSNCVVCQTEDQKRLLKINASKNGRVIKNIYIPSFSHSNNELKHLLWVGRIVEFKCPEIYLELAKNLPEYNFKMIGGINFGHEEYYNLLKDKSENIDNLEFLGYIPSNKIYQYYSKASVLINTSSTEGFPNTFLESWANQNPVVSLNFDPDNIITKYKLGYNSRNFNELLNNTVKIIENDNLREIMGNNGLNYVKREHNSPKIAEDYERLIDDLTNKYNDDL